MPILLLEDGSDLLLEGGGSDLLLEGDTPTATTLALIPGRVPKAATTPVTFLGMGTTWLSTPPAFAASGAPSDDPAWHVGTVTVVDDATATASVTAGAVGGSVLFRDPTTDAAALLFVGALSPIVMLRPAPTRWYRGGR